MNYIEPNIYRAITTLCKHKLSALETVQLLKLVDRLVSQHTLLYICCGFVFGLITTAIFFALL